MTEGNSSWWYKTAKAARSKGRSMEKALYVLHLVCRPPTTGWAKPSHPSYCLSFPAGITGLSSHAWFQHQARLTSNSTLYMITSTIILQVIIFEYTQKERQTDIETDKDLAPEIIEDDCPISYYLQFEDPKTP